MDDNMCLIAGVSPLFMGVFMLVMYALLAFIMGALPMQSIRDSRERKAFWRQVEQRDKERREGWEIQ